MASSRKNSVTWWQGGRVAWWQGGMVAGWRGGVVAWWRGGVVAGWRGGRVAWQCLGRRVAEGGAGRSFRDRAEIVGRSWGDRTASRKAERSRDSKGDERAVSASTASASSRSSAIDFGLSSCECMLTRRSHMAVTWRLHMVRSFGLSS